MASELDEKELEFFKYNVEGHWDSYYIFVHLLTCNDEYLYTYNNEELICSED